MIAPSAIGVGSGANVAEPRPTHPMCCAVCCAINCAIGADSGANAAKSLNMLRYKFRRKVRAGAGANVEKRRPTHQTTQQREYDPTKCAHGLGDLSHESARARETHLRLTPFARTGPSNMRHPPSPMLELKARGGLTITGYPKMRNTRGASTRDRGPRAWTGQSRSRSCRSSGRLGPGRRARCPRPRRAMLRPRPRRAMRRLCRRLRPRVLRRRAPRKQVFGLLAEADGVLQHV